MKTKSLLLITNLLLFFFAGISAFFFVMVLFTNGINDFRAFLDYFPLFLTLVIPVYALIAVNHISKVESDNLRLRKIKIHSLIILSISFVSFVYGFINTFVSFGGNFLAGGPSKYFPLSFLILDLAYMGITAYILNLFKNEETQAEQADKKGPGKITADVFKHLYLLFALYFLGTFAFAFYSFDLSLEHVIGTLPLYLMMVTPSAVIIATEIVKSYCAEAKQIFARFIVGLSGLGFTAILAVWMFIYMGFKPNFVVDSLTASFPLDFAISINLGPILLVFLSGIAPLYIVVSHLLKLYCPFCKRLNQQKDNKNVNL